jgi:hypothetical protein
MNSSYFNSAAGAFLGIVFILMTLSIVSDGIYHAETPEIEGFVIEVAESASDDGAPVEEAAPELIEPLLASADPAKGESVFKKVRGLPHQRRRQCQQGGSGPVEYRQSPGRQPRWLQLFGSLDRVFRGR